MIKTNSSKQGLIYTRYSDLPDWEASWLRMAMQGIKLAVKSIVPLAAAVLLHAFLTPRPVGFLKAGVYAWGACEVMFALVSRKLSRMTASRRPVPLDDREMTALCNRITQNVGDMKHMLSRWLLEEPHEMYREHFFEWTSWMTFEKKDEHLTVHEHARLRRILALMGHQLAENPRAIRQRPRCMRPLIDTCPVQPKPLVLYLAVKCIHALAGSRLQHLGFRRETCGGLSYWHCPGDDYTAPVLFIHGLGVGLLPYAGKIQRLKQRYASRRIFLVELPHVSMSLHHHMLDRGQTLHAFDSLFERHALHSVSLVAHSYGTILASWLIQKRQHRLHSVTLLDPICFSMWDSTLVHNFLYARPISFSHELSNFIIAQDPLICHTTTQGIHWYDCVLFPQDIHVPANIFLAVHDCVIDALFTADHLRDLPPTGRVHLLETMHGGYLDSASFCASIIDTI